MIVLETNVISEALRPNPEPAVLSWLRAVPRRDCARKWCCSGTRNIPDFEGTGIPLVNSWL
jgi:predicted nucleic acid-binding protein